MILLPTTVVHVFNAYLVVVWRGVEQAPPVLTAEHPLLSVGYDMFHVMTGVEVGPIALTVQSGSEDLQTIDGWEIVAEAPFEVATTELDVQHYELGVEQRFSIDPGKYTVRASCNGYDAAMREGAATPGAPPVVSILLSFLPPNGKPGRMIRNESIHMQAITRSRVR